VRLENCEDQEGPPHFEKPNCAVGNAERMRFSDSTAAE
jgi:hypothetical protein